MVDNIPFGIMGNGNEHVCPIDYMRYLLYKPPQKGRIARLGEDVRNHVMECDNDWKRQVPGQVQAVLRHMIQLNTGLFHCPDHVGLLYLPVRMLTDWRPAAAGSVKGLVFKALGQEKHEFMARFPGQPSDQLISVGSDPRSSKPHSSTGINSDFHTPVHPPTAGASIACGLPSSATPGGVLLRPRGLPVCAGPCNNHS